MAPTGTPTTIERFTQLKAAPEGVTYHENVRIGHKHAYWVSILGVYTTAEILVLVTDRDRTRVRSFFSRHKNCPPELRRRELPLVDEADAFALARAMTHHWPPTTRHPFT